MTPSLPAIRCAFRGHPVKRAERNKECNDTAERITQLRSLRQRIRQIARAQPEIRELRKKLLAIGGTELVALPVEMGFDPLVPFHVKVGELIDAPIRLKLMEASNCHWNVKRLWHRKKHGGLLAIATGYALSDDGLWRGHSWGIAKGTIVETTEERLKYFGVMFDSDDAFNFIGRFQRHQLKEVNTAIARSPREPKPMACPTTARRSAPKKPTES